MDENYSFGKTGGTPSPEVDDQEIDIRQYLLAVLNKRWMILALTIIIVASAALYSFLKTPLYRSKAVIDLSPPTAYIILPDSAAQSRALRSDSFMNTQYRLLKGKGIARRTAENLNLTLADLKEDALSIRKSSDQEKRNSELDQIANIILGMLKVDPIEETDLCEIIFTTPDPDLSMRLANTWATMYVSSRLDSVQQYTRTTEELLVEQVKSLQDEIAEKERSLHTFSLENGIIKTEKNRSYSTVRLAELNTELASASKERISAEIRHQAVSSSRPDSVPEVLQNASVLQRKAEYSSLQQKYEEKARLYKPDYPEMIRLQAQISQAQKGIQVALTDAYQQIIATSRAQYQEASIRERNVQGHIETALRQSAESGNKELDFEQIQMEVDNKRQILALLLTKQTQTGVTAQVQEKTTPASRIIEYAEKPSSIFEPNIKKNILFSFFVGLAISVGLALALEYFDKSLKTADDVERLLRLPFLGMIPFYMAEDDNETKNSKALVKTGEDHKAIEPYGTYRMSILDPASVASEAVKTVRTSLMLAFPEAPPKSILITSSRAGEGKTFTACNLAVALTQLDKRVVLVDADMRKPNVHRIWSMTNERGLSNYLTSECPIASVLRASPVSRLSLISSGPKTPRPAELLASDRFCGMLKELEKEYDFIIVDSPPVLPVTDSVIIASRVQSIVMVVRGGVTPRDIVKMARRKLSVSNNAIAGTVLNGIDLADPYYYFQYYSNYYSSYYTESTSNNGHNGSES